MNGNQGLLELPFSNYMNAPKPAPHLSASTVGEYVWFNEQPASRLDLKQWAINRSSAASQRESRLGHIAAPPNLVLWDVSGRKDVALDDLQMERIVQISKLAPISHQILHARLLSGALPRV